MRAPTRGPARAQSQPQAPNRPSAQASTQPPAQAPPQALPQPPTPAPTGFNVPHPLDNPGHASLTGPHARFAERRGRGGGGRPELAAQRGVGARRGRGD
ncbi:hypothetical protein ACFVZ2_39030, partial [Streptomyces lasiicapitis]